jgi:hypothetical protein
MNGFLWAVRCSGSEESIPVRIAKAPATGDEFPVNPAMFECGEIEATLTH